MSNKKIIVELKKLNFKLYFALFLMGFFPTLYTTVRIFLLSGLPSEHGLNIASQLAWLNIIYEVLAEAIILPLFFFTGAVVKDKTKLLNRTKTGLLIVLVINTTLAVLIIAFAKQLVLLMAVDSTTLYETISFIRLESVAKIFEILLKVLLVVVITIGDKLNIYIILITKMVLTVCLDIFFLSSLPISLNLGVNGIAFSDLISNFVLFIISVLLLKRIGLNIFSKTKLKFSWLKRFAKVGIISGTESLVRNLAFMFMIIRMVNVVGEQGDYWVANSFIWSFLLLPVLQLGELIKRDCGQNNAIVKQNICGYFSLTTIIVVTWFVSIPLWKPFLKTFMGINNTEEIFSIVMLLLGFYVVFAYNNIIDSIFYGIGRTDYILYQSLVVNMLYYGTAFVLYVFGVYVPTLNSVALMFGIGIVIDSVVTFLIFGKYYRKL